MTRANQPADQQPSPLISELSRTLAAANDYLTLLLHQAGLTQLVTSHGDILMQLFAHEPMTMQELSEKINRDPSTVTVLVKKLKDAGYVETCKGEQDRRCTEVRLTPEGRKLRSAFDSISQKLLSAQMRDVNTAELATVRSTLSQIKDNFRYAYQQESEKGKEEEA